VSTNTPEECLRSNHWHDEGDNLGLLNDHHLRAVMNSGHRRGGFIKRAVGKQGTRRYYTFALLAVAAVGTLPRPLIQ
jgi:hypothetical protein